MPVVGISAIELRAIGSVFTTRGGNLRLLRIIPTANVWEWTARGLHSVGKDKKFAIAVYGAFVLDWGLYDNKCIS